MTTTGLTARWLTELSRQLRRGRHVVLYGNVLDHVLYDGAPWRFRDAIDELLSREGYTLVAHYDRVDGVTFPEAEMLPRFREIESPGVPVGPVDARMDGPGQKRAPLAAAAPAPAGPYLKAAEQAVAAMRRALAQPAEPVACVFDFSDLLVGNAEGLGGPDRELLLTLARAGLDAHVQPLGRMAGMRNVLILVASQLGKVSPWLYRDNPTFAVIAVEKPSVDEREAFLTERWTAFNGAVGPAPSPEALKEFTALTEGLTHSDLEAIRLASHRDRRPVTGMRALIDFFKHGIVDNRWERLGKALIEQARPKLAARVVGQDAAIDAVRRVLVLAHGGVRVDPTGHRLGRPQGVLFFVGPTGVGKTELAKALTELLFDDERAFARFDMSEYQEEHAAIRLVGAPPSYVGHEAGGQLTNRLKEQPFSVLLFDEIEKAHPRVLDKFLQILDDGRLTDGLGETVYFSQSLVIFTSNIGATQRDESGRVVPAIRPDMSLGEIERHFRAAVRDHFVGIGRPELLGRIGDQNVIVFDMLREAHVPTVARKFLGFAGESVRMKHGIAVRFDDSVIETATDAARSDEVLLFGYRGVRSWVESTVTGPLAEFTLDPDGARAAVVSWDQSRIVVRPE